MRSTYAFIDSDIQKHFDLDLKLLSPLKRSCKLVGKAYQSSKSAKRAKSGGGIPAWYECSDNKGLIFMPGVLAEELAKNAQVFYAAGRYYLYSDGVYREMTKMEAQRIVQEKMLTRETKMAQISDAEQQWRLQILKPIRELNPNPYIINLQNGLYNVLDGTLSAHTPKYYSTIRLPVSFDETADCPRFMKYLKEVMDDDMSQIELLQEIMGYFLVPLPSAQKAFVLVGEAKAGKSVLLNVVSEILLGTENVSNVSLQDLNERFRAVKLYGKLANVFGDLPTKGIDDNGQFKALVGEDTITVEEKNQPAFSFKSVARMLFSCNSIPRNYGDRSEGFYRRLVIIRFKHAVPEDKRDPELLDKFRTEADGIFQFALTGLRRLMDNKFKFSETQANLDEVQTYREESNSVLSFFSEYCELDPTQEVGSTELYNVYKAYCNEAGLRPYSQKTFVGEITTAFSDVTSGKDTVGRRRVLKGVKMGEILA